LFVFDIAEGWAPLCSFLVGAKRREVRKKIELQFA
jgi:hypothetical protein